jgi:hypothetical protein
MCRVLPADAQVVNMTNEGVGSGRSRTDQIDGFVTTSDLSDVLVAGSSLPPARDTDGSRRGQLHRSSVEILPTVVRKRFQFRPPGLKPTTKVGTLGPYRGRLGLAWVIAPLVAGVVIVVAGILILTR